MSAKSDRIIRQLAGAIQSGGKPKTSPYDTTATVRRIENGVAWVHIPGGVDETPVRMTINAAPGDQVQVRVSGGRAFLVGNATAPPTDDKMAVRAVKAIAVTNKVVETVKRVADRASKIAGNTAQYFWHTETGTDTGVHITEIPQDEFLADPENGGGNLLARSNGVAVRDGLTELATFSADGMQINAHDENFQDIPVAHLGYGDVQTQGLAGKSPYYTLGTRRSGYVGAYSTTAGVSCRALEYAAFAEGWQTDAIGEASHAEGNGTIAGGNYSHAGGIGTYAGNEASTVVGKYNSTDQKYDDALFAVGNGTGDNSRGNAFTVFETGDAEIEGDLDVGGMLTGELPGALYDYAAGSEITVNTGAWSGPLSDSNFLLSAGRWLVLFGADFSQNANGYRMVQINTISTGGSGNRYTPTANAVNGNRTRLTGSVILTPAAQTAYNIYTYQNSGSQLTVAPWARFVKIG